LPATEEIRVRIDSARRFLEFLIDPIKVMSWKKSGDFGSERIRNERWNIDLSEITGYRGFNPITRQHQPIKTGLTR
jgi:hypothetical protein